MGARGAGEARGLGQVPAPVRSARGPFDKRCPLGAERGPSGARARSAALAFALGLLALSAACAAPRPTRVVPWSDGAPAVLLRGGSVRVGDGAVADALLVRGGRVVASGTAAELARLAPPGTAVVELGGAVVVPGFQDAHGHVEGYGESLEQLDLVGCPSYAELVRRAAERAAELAPGEWVLGRGWDQTLWPGAEFPHHAALSAAVPDHPVLLERVDGHAALANARALELAGLHRGSASVPGGRALSDESGPTGVLVDAAVELVARCVPAPDRAARERRILRAQRELLATGLVAVHDMGIGPETLAAYESLQRSGRLELRVFAYLAGNDGLSDEELSRGPARLGVRLQIRGVKLVADGALGSRGAWLLAPYADEPGHSGLALLSRETLAERVAECARAGLQPATHAIGDAANRAVLDAYEERLRVDPDFAALRPRVEHAQVVAPRDLARFAELGVVPSVQPTHATSDMRWAAERLGSARLSGAYAWRALAPGSSALALGSDFPVESPRPLLGIYAARTRQDASGRPIGGFLPDQRLSGEEALAGFTSGAARAVGGEDELGSLLPGRAADFAILDVDPVTSAPRALLDARVLLTAIDGRVVFRASGAAR